MLGPSYACKISRFTFLEIYVSRDFFPPILAKSREKKSREKNLEIFGGDLANFFCEVNLEIFLEIFVSRDLLFIISFRKSRDFLS